MSSGIDNTFRQLGIAIGIAGLGAIFAHHADAGTAAGIAHGLDAVALVAAIVALLGAAIAWPLLGAQRASVAQAGTDRRRSETNESSAPGASR